MNFVNFLKENSDLGSNDYKLILELINAEHDAVIQYQNLAAKTDNKLLKKLFMDIAEEEKVHLYELQAAAKSLQSDAALKLKIDAENEVKELFK